jgi:hypothetical protein
MCLIQICVSASPYEQRTALSMLSLSPLSCILRIQDSNKSIFATLDYSCFVVTGMSFNPKSRNLTFLKLDSISNNLYPSGFPFSRTNSGCSCFWTSTISDSSKDMWICSVQQSGHESGSFTHLYIICLLAFTIFTWWSYHESCLPVHALA